jgi:Protein of unknown function (DUF3089)
LKYQKQLFFVLLPLAFFSCTPSYKAFNKQYKADFEGEQNEVPRYNNLNYWAAHPWKKDPSDSIPRALLNEARDSSVDVFFIHPTTFTNKKLNGIVWNAPINDAELNAKTDYSSILYQASVFNASARVFAPRYRQAHLYSFFTEDANKGKDALQLAYKDVRNAFEYYLKHHNNGRPIIIASHSQGTVHAGMLLKEFFENKPLQKKLICAYIIGMVQPKNYFNELLPCRDSKSTGCFTAWRTYRKNYLPEHIQKENNSSWVINPLSWTMDSVFVTRKENKGAVLYNFNKIIKHTNGAGIHKGVLWIERPKFPGSLFYFSKNYHPGDINLFYLSIRENVKERIAAYFQANSK